MSEKNNKNQEIKVIEFPLAMDAVMEKQTSVEEIKSKETMYIPVLDKNEKTELKKIPAEELVPESIDMDSAEFKQKINEIVTEDGENKGAVTESNENMANYIDKHSEIAEDGKPIENTENYFFPLLKETGDGKTIFEKATFEQLFPDDKEDVDLSIKNVVYVKPEIDEEQQIEGKIYKTYAAAKDYIKEQQAENNNEKWVIELCTNAIEDENDNIVLERNIFVRGNNTRIHSSVIPYVPLKIKINIFNNELSDKYSEILKTIIQTIYRNIIDHGVNAQLSTLSPRSSIEFDDNGFMNEMVTILQYIGDLHWGAADKIFKIHFIYYCLATIGIIKIESDDEKINEIFDRIYNYMLEFIKEYDPASPLLPDDEASSRRRAPDPAYERFEELFNKQAGNYIYSINNILCELYVELKNITYIKNCIITKVDMDYRYNQFGIDTNSPIIKNLFNNILRWFGDIETMSEDDEFPINDKYEDLSEENNFTIFVQALNAKECVLDMVGTKSIKAEIFQNTIRGLLESASLLFKRYINLNELYDLLAGIVTGSSLGSSAMEIAMRFLKIWDDNGNIAPLGKVVNNVWYRLTGNTIVPESDPRTRAATPEITIDYETLFGIIKDILVMLQNGAIDINLNQFQKCKIVGDLDFPYNTMIMADDCTYVIESLYEENLLNGQLREKANYRGRQIVCAMFVELDPTQKEVDIFIKNIFSTWNDNWLSTYQNIGSFLYGIFFRNNLDTGSWLFKRMDNIVVKFINLYNNYKNEDGKIKLSIDPTIISSDYENEKLVSLNDIINVHRKWLFPADHILEDQANYNQCYHSDEEVANPTYTSLSEIYERSGMNWAATPSRDKDTEDLIKDITVRGEFEDYVNDDISIHDLAALIVILSVYGINTFISQYEYIY